MNKIVKIEGKGQEGKTKIQKSISLEIEQELHLEQESDTDTVDRSNYTNKKQKINAIGEWCMVL